VNINSWVGLVAPARTPAPIVARLDAALRQTLASDDVKARLLNSGASVVKSSPELFAGQIAADFNQWKRVVKESRIRLEA
jgi:tripartite-type tricarboxylate transporter receptor subunit TctC